MRDEAKSIRQQQIESAAYEVLEARGFTGTSMLAIAKMARASNETLYNWYGDKTGLFKALVARNAAEIKAVLESRIAANREPIETLRELGPMLLDVLTGARAVALNRAAAADPSGELGAAISSEGRETIGPLIAQVLLQAREQGELTFSKVDHALELYLNLLVGDLQIRRVIGRVQQPSDATLRKRSENALSYLIRLLG